MRGRRCETWKGLVRRVEVDVNAVVAWENETRNGNERKRTMGGRGDMATDGFRRRVEVWAKEVRKYVRMYVFEGRPPSTDLDAT